MLLSIENRRVVVFGAGFFGELICENLLIHWSESVDVIGMADNNLELNERIKKGEKIFKKDILNDRITQIYTVDELAYMQKYNLIDGVVLGVGKKYTQEIIEQLKKYSIQILEYPNYRKRSLDDMQKNAFCVGVEKVRFHILEGVCIVNDIFSPTTWMTDEEGCVLEEILCGETFPASTLLRHNGKEKVIEAEICIFTRLHLSNYWHFLYEIVDKVLLLQSEGYQGMYMLYDKPYIRTWMRILSIPDEKIVYVDIDDKKSRYLCKKAIYPEFWGGLSARTTKILCDWAEKIVAETCQNLSEEAYASKVYIKRIGSRKWIGAEEILENYGFKVIVPEELSVIEQIRVFYMADVIVCPHGANSSNVLFMRPKTTFIEGFGYSYVKPHCMHVIDRKNINYHMLVEQKDNCDKDKDWLSDFTIQDVMLKLALKDCV